jgi:hypothetical protein
MSIQLAAARESLRKQQIEVGAIKDQLVEAKLAVRNSQDDQVVDVEIFTVKIEQMRQQEDISKAELEDLKLELAREEEVHKTIWPQLERAQRAEQRAKEQLQNMIVRYDQLRQWTASARRSTQGSGAQPQLDSERDILLFEEKAATKIQAYFRGLLTRQELCGERLPSPRNQPRSGRSDKEPKLESLREALDQQARETVQARSAEARALVENIELRSKLDERERCLSNQPAKTQSANSAGSAARSALFASASMNASISAGSGGLLSEEVTKLWDMLKQTKDKDTVLTSKMSGSQPGSSSARNRKQPASLATSSGSNLPSIPEASAGTATSRSPTATSPSPSRRRMNDSILTKVFNIQQLMQLEKDKP